MSGNSRARKKKIGKGSEDDFPHIRTRGEKTIKVSFPIFTTVYSISRDGKKKKVFFCFSVSESGVSEGRKKSALLAKALSPSIPPLLHIYQGSEISFWGGGREWGGGRWESTVSQKKKGESDGCCRKSKKGGEERDHCIWQRELRYSWTIFPKKDLPKKGRGFWVPLLRMNLFINSKSKTTTCHLPHPKPLYLTILLFIRSPSLVYGKIYFPPSSFSVLIYSSTYCWLFLWAINGTAAGVGGINFLL